MLYINSNFRDKMWFSVKLWICKGENDSNDNTQIKEDGANLGLEFGFFFSPLT